MSVQHVKKSTDAYAEIMTVRDAYGTRPLYCAYCGAEGHGLHRGDTFSFRIANGLVHTNPICIMLSKKHKRVDYSQIDIDKIISNMHSDPVNKGTPDGPRIPKEIEFADEDESENETEISLLTQSALVKHMFYSMASLDIGNSRDLVDLYINQYNAYRLGGNYLNLDQRFIAAEPYDYYTSARCIQFCLHFSGGDQNTKLMINMYFNNRDLFLKMRNKLFYKKRCDGDKHNYPKYRLVQIYGDKWTYVASWGDHCGDACKLYRNTCAYCETAHESCDGLIYTYALTSRYVESIPGYKLDYATAKNMVDSRSKRRQ